MVVEAAINEVPQSEAAAVRNLAALIERMRIGQERALEELYEATVGKLYALASAILRSERIGVPLASVSVACVAAVWVGSRLTG